MACIIFNIGKSEMKKMAEQHHICLAASAYSIIVQIFMNQREEMCLVCFFCRNESLCDVKLRYSPLSVTA